MSKASLRKELISLDHDQLVEVILNAYSSSKEAKEYFEFFLNPDANALMEKKIDIISKELVRSKRGYSKARISVIRNTIKDFAAYGVGDDYVYRLTLNTIRMIVGMERYYYYPEALIRGAGKLAEELIALADKMADVERAVGDLEQMRTDDIGRSSFREQVIEAARISIRNIQLAKPKK